MINIWYKNILTQFKKIISSQIFYKNIIFNFGNLLLRICLNNKKVWQDNENNVKNIYEFIEIVAKNGHWTTNYVFVEKLRTFE